MRLKNGFYIVTYCLFVVAMAGCRTGSAGRASGTAPVEPLHNIPRIAGLTVDGDAADWKDRGLRVRSLINTKGELPAPDDFSAEFRLAWDHEGLWLLLNTRDDIPMEVEEDGEQPWSRDSVEFFVARERGARDFYQIIFVPGRDAINTNMWFLVVDRRKDEGLKEQPLAVDVARLLTDDGYTLEARFPWSNLGIDPKEGVETAFQIYVADADPEDGATFVWYPGTEAWRDSSHTRRLRLAERPGPDVTAGARAEYRDMAETVVHAGAVADRAGDRVSVCDGQEELARGRLEAVRGGAATELVFPLPEPGRPYGPLDVRVAGQSVAVIELPDLDQQRTRTMLEQGPVFQPCVFSGKTFPKCDFSRPLFVERLIGPYETKVTYYDVEFNEVSSSTNAGRYGAAVDIIPERGLPLRRYRTLFRQPERTPWWRTDLPISVEFPPAMGIRPEAMTRHQREVADMLKWMMVENFSSNSRAGAILAGLYESEGGEPLQGNQKDALDTLGIRDRQWWVDFKRHHSGDAARYGNAFACPRPSSGSPSPVVHEGSILEAGMQGDAAERIDALLREWSANTDEAFAVCIVRRGVVVIHRAYGERNGKPMTVDTPSGMASITKLMSGTLMMMLVDQGFVDLDDRVDKHLQEFRDIEVEIPLTVRHCYRHTNGLWGHWGDNDADFEHMIAYVYPYLEVGVRHAYNGAGCALGGKIIERISGECIPRFYYNHLLGPLGCEHTQVSNTSGDARSIPLDMAKIGQMLLNRGAYGNMRFFSEETFRKMLPLPVQPSVRDPTDIEWGIGCIWYKDEPFGKSTFGHGAASSATLRIDPENELVIVMTRNSAGKEFKEYHPRFIQAVYDALLE